jgi:hypothetical protein
LLAPKDKTDAEEGLPKLAHVASDRRRPTAGSDFSAGPRVTEPSLDATLCPADLNNEPLPTDRPSLGRRTSRSLARFLVTACIGSPTGAEPMHCAVLASQSRRSGRAGSSRVSRCPNEAGHSVQVDWWQMPAGRAHLANWVWFKTSDQGYDFVQRQIGRLVDCASSFIP